MNRYVTAGKGKRFALTEFGLEQYNVRAKFQEGYTYLARYQKMVPKSWVDKGYVVEVNNGEE